jgi:hypothetical protein
MWLVRDLVMRCSFMPLLAEDVQVVLLFYEPLSLPIDGLSASFGALHCGRPSQYGLLFLSDTFDFLLNSC